MRDSGKNGKRIERVQPLRPSGAKLERVSRKSTEHKRAEEALRESEERYRSFVQHFQGIAFRGKIDFTPVFFHGAVEAITGYTEDDFVTGNPRWDQVIHPDDLPNISESIEKIRVVPAYSTEREYRIVRKDRQIRWIREFIQNICDKSGEPILVQGALYDITEYKRAEEVLRESEARFRDISQNIGDLIWEVDENVVFNYCSDGAQVVFGYPASAVIGKTPFDFMRTEDAERVKPIVRKMFEQRKPIRDFENYYLHKDGKPRCLVTNGVPVFDKNATFKGYRGLCKDITARKQAEEALIESEKNYRELVETSLDMIFVLDVDGNFRFTNRAWSEHIGYSYDEAMKLNGFDLIHPEDVKETRRRFTNVIKGKAEKNVEFRSKTKSGEYRNILINGSPIFNSKGNVTSVLGAGTDITERKQAEQILQRKTRQQEQLLGIARHLTASLDVKDVLSRIATGAKEILKAHACAIYLLEDDGKMLTPVVAIEPPYEKEILSAPLKVDSSFTGCAVKAKRGLIFNDAAINSSGYHIPGTPPVEDERIIVAPFIIEDNVLGAMCLNRIGDIFTEDDLILAEAFATYAATALKNAQVHHELKHEVQERKRAEEQIKQYQFMVESAHDAIFFKDLKSRYIIANDVTLEAFGLSRQQVIGKNDYEIMPKKEEAKKNIEDDNLVFKTGKPTDFSKQMTSTDGRKRWFEAVKAPHFDNKGNVIGLIGVARDITERKQTEQQFLSYQEQLKSLASELSMTEERERRRLAVGMHDQIGQELALTKLTLQSLVESASDLADKSDQERLEALDNISASLDKVCATVDQVIENAHSLTFELSNPMLYELGFEAAVEHWLAEQIQEKHGVKYKFDTDTQPLQLDSKVSIVLFRAVRELLVNVVKHAQATNVGVRIQKADDKTQVTVEDDGVGFWPSKPHLSLPENKIKGFGLFSIREQMEYLGGDMKVKSAPGKGSCITLTAPLKWETK